jgi:DNA-damage-inducible protein D
MTPFNIQSFEDSAQQNGVCYWHAHQFMGALGYEHWPTFQKVINRAISSCARLGIDISEVFIPQVLVQEGKVIHTFKLTRFACFLITTHADDKKPEVASAKLTLADLADALISEKIQEGAFERIEVRDELKAGESVMTGAAKAAGLESSQFGLFKDAGFRGMYNMPLKELIAHKGTPDGKTLYDFMGKTELAANLFRVTQTAERIKHQNLSGLIQVKDAATRVGQDVRSVMLKSSGVKPEDLPAEQHIDGIKKQIKTAHKAMKKLDSQSKKTRKQSI